MSLLGEKRRMRRQNLMKRVLMKGNRSIKKKDIKKKGLITFDKIVQVGINYYNTEYQLNGCINDVINLSSYLKENYNVIQSQILTDAKSSKLQPTRDNVIKACQWLVKDAKAGNRLFFHYSGHGSYQTDTNKDENDGKDEVICCVDNNIVDDDLRKILVDTLPKGVQLYCLFDCCHSGTVLDLRYNYKIQNNKELIIQTDVHYNSSNGQVYLLSGCMDNQTSADAWEENKAQGAMTYGLIKTLKTLKSKKLAITGKNIMLTLTPLLKNKGYTQIPQLSTGQVLNVNETIL